MHCSRCRQKKLKPSRSLNLALSPGKRFVWIHLRCYRCGTIKVVPRALWAISDLIERSANRGRQQKTAGGNVEPVVD
jgi:hypothetical protein